MHDIVHELTIHAPLDEVYTAVSTGPGLTVFTRTPRGPNSLDSALLKLASALFAAL